MVQSRVRNATIALMMAFAYMKSLNPTEIIENYGFRGIESQNLNNINI